MKLTSSVPRIALSAALFLLCCILYHIYKIFLPTSLSSLFLLFLLFEGAWYLKLCWSIVFTLFQNSASWVFYYILIFFHVLNEQNFQGNEGYLCTFIFLLCTSFLIFFLDRKNIRPEKYIYYFHTKDYVLLIVVCLVNFILSSTTNSLYFNEFNDYGKKFILLFFIAVMPMSMILIITYFRIQRLYHALDQTNQINVQLMRKEEHYYKSIQKKTQDLRAFRHDYRNHLTALRSLAGSARWDELLDYLDKLSDIKESTSYISTNHTVADAILNDYYEQFSTKIDFHIDGKFTDPLFVSDTDLCIILSNLIKNAIEASENILAENKDKTKKPQVCLLISSHPNELSIKMMNPSPEMSQWQLEHMRSTKDDLLNHGFGIRNIRNAVQNYDGVLDMDYSDGVFTSTVYLKAPLQKTNN